MGLLASLCGYLTAPLLLSVILLLVVVQHSLGVPWAFDGAIKLLCRAIPLTFGIRIRSSGRHRIDRDPGKTRIFMCNHVNIFDPLILFGCISGHVRGIELEDHFSWPLWGQITKWIGNIPISHRNTSQAIRSLELALGRINDGVSICILPEGHRTRDGLPGPFMRGPFRLASRAAVEIVPMALAGAYERKNVHSPLVRPGVVEVRFGEAIPAAQVTSATERDLAVRAKLQITSLLSGRPVASGTTSQVSSPDR